MGYSHDRLWLFNISWTSRDVLEALKFDNITIPALLMNVEQNIWGHNRKY